MPQGQTYISELVGRGWLLVLLLGMAFYLTCFLHAKGHISQDSGVALIGTYWAASALYLAKNIYDEFPRFYKITLSRMRRYSSVRWFLLWYAGFSVIFVPAVIYGLLNFREEVKVAINSWSIKPVLAPYAASLLCVMFVFTVICSFVAESRGTRQSK